MSERERRRRIIEYLRSGNLDDAATELAASREVYPGDGALHHIIGMGFASTGTLRQALDELELAVRLDPDSAEIHADLAQVQLARGETEAAIGSAERAVALSPELPIAQFTLGRACYIAELVRQSKRPPSPQPGEHFPLVDGRATNYLRALEEMELALDASPPFIGVIRSALASAYERAGHFHAARDQLQAILDKGVRDEEAQRVRSRLADIEHEITREKYWTLGEANLTQLIDLARSPEARPETKLRLAHAYAALGRTDALPAALAEAHNAGYDVRDAHIVRSAGETRDYPAVSDAHILIAGGFECIIEEELRFLPFASIRQITFGSSEPWRPAQIDLTSGERIEAIMPALYRFSCRSSNEHIQGGRFTQFSYAPGDARYAYVIGARNFATDAGTIPVSEIESVAF